MKSSNLYRAFLFIILPTACLAVSCDFNGGATANTPTPTNCLDASSPTESDTEFVLEYKWEVFNDSLWEKSYQLYDERVTVTWLNNTDEAITHMEYVIFPCGYSQATVDKYFSRTNFVELIFQNYEGVEFLDSCSTGDALRLEEIFATSEGRDYRVQFWIVTDNPTRILDIFIAYPAGQESTLNRYASDLFPTLPACPE